MNKMTASQTFILTAVLYLEILMCINSELFYKINIILYNKTILTNSKLYFGLLNCEKLGSGHYYIYIHIFFAHYDAAKMEKDTSYKTIQEITRYQCYFLTLTYASRGILIQVHQQL